MTGLGLGGAVRAGCVACGADFYGLMDRDRHRVYNAALQECWDKWCLSEFGMDAIGMRQDGEGRWYVVPGAEQSPG